MDGGLQVEGGRTLSAVGIYRSLQNRSCNVALLVVADFEGLRGGSWGGARGSGRVKGALRTRRRASQGAAGLSRTTGRVDILECNVM